MSAKVVIKETCVRQRNSIISTSGLSLST